MVYTQQMLDEAEAALHEIMLGRGVAEVRDQNGETLRYSKVNIAELRSYILTIQHALGVAPKPGTGRAWF